MWIVGIPAVEMDTTIDNIDGGFFIQVQLFGDVGIEGDD
jgi:hypothetical protein